MCKFDLWMLESNYDYDIESMKKCVNLRLWLICVYVCVCVLDWVTLNWIETESKEYDIESVWCGDAHVK